MEEDRKPPKANGGVATAAPDKDTAAAAAEHAAGRPAHEGAPARHDNTPAGRAGYDRAGVCMSAAATLSSVPACEMSRQLRGGHLGILERRSRPKRYV